VGSSPTKTKSRDKFSASKAIKLRAENTDIFQTFSTKLNKKRR